MCIFRYQELQWDRRILKADAITAYKAIAFNYEGRFQSPFKYGPRGEWNRNAELHAGPIHGADYQVWRRRHNLFEERYNPGIHCMTTVRGARPHGSVIVRVSIWGRVIRYRGRGGNIFPGYLAQSARIEAIVEADMMYSDRSVVKMLKRHPRILDERKKR